MEDACFQEENPPLREKTDDQINVFLLQCPPPAALSYLTLECGCHHRYADPSV